MRWLSVSATKTTSSLIQQRPAHSTHGNHDGKGCLATFKERLNLWRSLCFLSTPHLELWNLNLADYGRKRWQHHRPACLLIHFQPPAQPFQPRHYKLICTLCNKLNKINHNFFSAHSIGKDFLFITYFSITCFDQQWELDCFHYHLLLKIIKR